ncbi:MAG: hypothetical protein LBF62_13090 [Tannerellaceae bacterium]|nr:hypothetical protein [Tannerellaceae bacterium]
MEKKDEKVPKGTFEPPSKKQPRKNQFTNPAKAKNKLKMNQKNYNGTILALDVASKKTGYAIYEEGEIFKHGTWKLSKDEYCGSLASNVEKFIKEYGITLIVVEDIFRDKDVRKDKSFQILSECRGAVQAIADWHNIPVTAIEPVRVKRKIWGYNPSREYYRNLTRPEHKQRMILAVQILGYGLENDRADDEADAIGLMITYLDIYRYLITHPKYKLSKQTT